MQCVSVSDPEEFLRRAQPLLVADEARNNLILGIVGTIVADPAVYPEHHLWLVVEGDVPKAAAVRTPPYNLVLGDTPDPAAIEMLAACIADREGPVPGVVGNRPGVDVFLEAWKRETGELGLLEMAQGVYSIENLIMPARPRGDSRPATPSDHELAVDWIERFTAELPPYEAPDSPRVRRYVERRLDSNTRDGIWLWEAGGDPVSLCGYGGETPNGIRIGPVYTPPGLRGNGYASALVADVTAAQLAAGRRFCFLFTDLANPTSNRIYSRLGYRQVGESAVFRFDRRDH